MSFDNSRESVLSKKLLSGDIYLSIKLSNPFHNLKNRKFQVFINCIGSELNNDDGNRIRLIYSYSCLCEPSSESTSLVGSNGYSNDLNDKYIDPLTRMVTIQSTISPKEVTQSEDGKSLFIKVGNYGKNPGRTQIKFLALVFEIQYQNQYYQAYITIKTQRGSGVEQRGCTTKESCFISDAVQNEEDEFIQAFLRFNSLGSSLSNCSSPTNRRRTPNSKPNFGSVFAEQKFVNFMEGTTDSLDRLTPDIIAVGQSDNYDDEIDYQNSLTDFYNTITFTKIHFENGPKQGGQPNTLYLSFKDSSKTGLYELIKHHSMQSISMWFVPKHHPEVQVGLPQILHISEIGNYAALHFITSPVLTHFEGDLDSCVFLVIDNEIIDGLVDYTFVDISDNIQSTDYYNTEENLRGVQYTTQQGGNTQTTSNYSLSKYSPVVTILNIGQFAKQQYQQSMDKFENLGHFIENFQMQFGKIIDVFGYNFAGFLKSNGFVVEGVTFEEVICPTSSNEQLVTIEPAEVRKEEKVFGAEEVTDMIVKSIQNRISLEDEKMIENSVQTLAHKSSDLDTKQAEEYIVINTVVPKHLEANYNPGKRHARNDKEPYLNLKFVIYDANALPSQDAQNNIPKLKVALFFAKFVISFDDKTHLIVIEDQEKKENFLYQTFYDCNIYKVRKNEEIDSFLYRLAEFNCAWNCSQFYDEKNSNTGHYVISVLKYLKIWDPSALWAKFAINVCEGKPLEKHVTIYPDFFHMDSKQSIPAMLNGTKAAECPKLKDTITGYVKQSSDAPFKYHFSGYSDDPEVEAKAARTELEFMYELLRECGESYLRILEDSVRAQRLLKKIMQTNYGQSLSSDTWQHLKQLSDKHNQTFHKQMYNFPNFFNLIKPTKNSEVVEKAAKNAWRTMQESTNMQLSEPSIPDVPDVVEGKIHFTNLDSPLNDNPKLLTLNLSGPLPRSVLPESVTISYELDEDDRGKVLVSDSRVVNVNQTSNNLQINFEVPTSNTCDFNYFKIQARMVVKINGFPLDSEEIIFTIRHDPSKYVQVCTGSKVVNANGQTLTLFLRFSEPTRLNGVINLYSSMKCSYITPILDRFQKHSDREYSYTFQLENNYDIFHIFVRTEAEDILVGTIHNLEFKSSELEE
ncbi:hypothetical protein NAEGRDRAFT_79332 [Naegleria gruberi]|uniref:Uncharacterized protein n=1 Tax=Naegleria gruberi TaxID=5762 RepID=D2VBN0_NAEGR|nr:uncharacterized protein NAEGRDRAFT_79332 [Naegleria gruberi]EFC45825.1 hypothetical protein NAEGRDRAFT_79332 [Naegleria gruberi]|eukprot:XP_002678569.1 hypothetical protein NAEGRDRAFT_79332 [Naegleria gruberi strain NEG-M]